MWKMWKKAPKISYVMDMCPLHMILSDEVTTLTKDGVMTRVFEIRGKDYTGMNEADQVSYHDRRKQFFESVGDHLKMTVYSHRYRLGRDIKNENHGNPISNEIASRWSNQFESSYRTRHFIALSTKNGSVLDATAGKIIESNAPQNDIERLNLLDDVSGVLMKQLEVYRPNKLKADNLASFWAWLLNGKSVSQVIPKSLVFDDLLAGSDLLWPGGENYQIYRTDKDTYSAWITIKTYPNDTGDRMMDSLFETTQDFSLIQHYEMITKNKALYLIEDKVRFNASLTKAGGMILDELRELYELIESDNMSICKHGYTVQVYGDTLEELKKAIVEINGAVESWGIRTKRENKLQEPLFWSQFPGLEATQVRKREITTDNFTQFVNFPAIGEGLDSCSWGNTSAALFKSSTNSEFAFTFHESTGDQALGNTLILGGPGSGKTTLISFLETNILKFPKMRIVNFDRLHGMEVATRLQDGHYEDFNDNIELNPFQMENNNTNRVFLQNWLQMLSGRKDDVSIEQINLAIGMVYDLDKKDRTLSEMKSAFGIGGEKSLYGALKKWLPDGAYEGYFNSRKDSLSFDKRMITFDMTTQLDMPDVLGPTLAYIFHRLEQTIISDPSPFFVFVDEVKSFLDSPFHSKLNKATQEYRKLDGVLCMAGQRAGHVLDHPNAKGMMSNFATYLLYGDSQADESHYVDQLGLSQSEFKWIKSNSEPRKVLMKRPNTGEVAILDVDLSSIGELVTAYSSSAKNVDRLNKLRRKSSDWKEKYLYG